MTERILDLEGRLHALEKRFELLDGIDVPCVLTSPNGRLPVIAKPGDVAADIFAICYDDDDNEIPEVTVPARGYRRFGTGFSMALPTGYRATIISRSGLSLTYGIEAGAGLIDNGYRHEVGVILHNNSDRPFRVVTGMRIAQMAVEKYTRPGFVPVDSLPDGARGKAGWGSTGLFDETSR